MREIKFRGRKSNGEWIYGYYNRTYTYEQGYRDCIFNHNVGFVDVTPDTVGQFTGMHDKNGKEIYEGDVVLSKLKRARKYDEILQICFDDSEYCGKNKNGSSTSLSLLEDYHTVEVIGNIHDNPELLNE